MMMKPEHMIVPHTVLSNLVEMYKDRHQKPQKPKYLEPKTPTLLQVRSSMSKMPKYLIS